VNRIALTPRQRRVLLGLMATVVAVFGILAGYMPAAILNYSVETTETPVWADTLAETPLSSLGTPGVEPSDGIASQVQAARVFSQIQHQVELLRELPLLAQVPLTFPGELEMAGLLEVLYASRGWGERLEPHMLLGLLPQSEETLKQRTATTVYVPEQRQIYIANGARERTADDQALVVHAYAHALQHQHFDLSAAGNSSGTTDEALALEALLEGDTTLLAGLYRYGDLGSADWDILGEFILNAEQPSYGSALDHHPAFDRLVHFANWEGRQFAQTLYERGGWEAVDDAYADPPQSTEQVLHPERYGDEASAPIAVRVPGMSGAPGEGWSVVLEDTLGEFVMGLYLRLILPEERAWLAVDGWGGDTFVLWEHEDGRELSLWRSIWDTAEEAVEFESALFTLVPHGTPPVIGLDPPDGLDGHWYETGDGAVHISRVGRYVVYLRAPDVNTAANFAEQLP